MISINDYKVIADYTFEVFLKYFSLKLIPYGKKRVTEINKWDSIAVLTAAYAFILWCLKSVVLLLRGYRSRVYFPTIRRDVSAKLNGAE